MRNNSISSKVSKGGEGEGAQDVRSSLTVLGRDHAGEGITTATHREANIRADFSSRSVACGLGSQWSRMKV